MYLELHQKVSSASFCRNNGGLPLKIRKYLDESPHCADFQLKKQGT
jgi:hypothetical protein